MYSYQPSKRVVEKVLHIESTDSKDFVNRLSKNISTLQDDGLIIEIQYAHAKRFFMPTFSALVLAFRPPAKGVRSPKQPKSKS